MSRRRSPSAMVSRITEEEINELILKLQHLLPPRDFNSTSTTCNPKVSASKILKETCKYLKKLHKEVDDLSERLAELLTSGDIPAVDADTIRTMLRQEY